MSTVLAIPVGVAVVSGIVAGEVGGLTLGRRLLRSVNTRPEFANYVAKSARNGGLGASFVGLLCSFLIGGNFGGSTGKELVGAWNVPIGIFLGITTTLGILVSVGYVIAGRLAAATVRRYDA
jgi:hypothetical protein